jgi:phospholipid N-methyltransferase
VAPVRLSNWGLESKRLGTVMLNMPPATVYRFRRRRDASVFAELSFRF